MFTQATIGSNLDRRLDRSTFGLQLGNFETLIVKENFLRIGTGSLGGKARGLAFANTFWNQANITEKYSEVKFRVPKVSVVSTDEFDEFMEVNDLWEAALSLDNNKDLEEIFLKGRLSKKLIQNI